MRSILRKYFIAALSLFTLTQLIPAVVLKNSWYSLFYSAILLSILIYLVKPLINIIMLPINLVTMNLSSWFATIILFYLLTIIDTHINITSWNFSGFTFGPLVLSAYKFDALPTLIISAVILTLIINMYNWLIR